MNCESLQGFRGYGHVMNEKAELQEKQAILAICAWRRNSSTLKGNY
ncbi:MAG: hypothetical protein ACLUC1_04000 [Enterococcus gallinarum]